jgi:hypothetical protein
MGVARIRGDQRCIDTGLDYVSPESELLWVGRGYDSLRVRRAGATGSIGTRK